MIDVSMDSLFILEMGIGHFFPGPAVQSFHTFGPARARFTFTLDGPALPENFKNWARPGPVGKNVGPEKPEKKSLKTFLIE